MKSTHGGKRQGAGRPVGTIKKPPTCVMRVPVALRDTILSMISAKKTPPV